MTTFLLLVLFGLLYVSVGFQLLIWCRRLRELKSSQKFLYFSGVAIFVLLTLALIFYAMLVFTGMGIRAGA